MADTQTSFWDNLKQDGAKGILDLALGWGQSKLVDVEDRTSDRNIPDQNDLVNGNPAVASSDALGGSYTSAPASQWMKYGAFALAGVAALVIAKKVL